MTMNTAVLTVNSSSHLYFWIYVSITPLLWLVYLLASRNLYQEIFRRYPGISTVGKWILYATGAVTAVAAFISILFPGAPITASRTLRAVTVIDQCLLGGLSILLLLLVYVISRYPIDIPKNIAIHCLVLTAILFTQSLFLIVDQATAYHYAGRVNTLSAGASAICCLLWALLPKRQGDTANVRLLRRVDPAQESRLLIQLDTINSILLHATRK